jgi:MFS family permease
MGNAAYRYYVLALLVLIYAFNFLDRQVVTIIAPYLKKEMGISDAQIGLLFGTAFALFYAVFGLPLAKLADGWSRVRTISLGLTFWSAMTAISGMAGNFAQLGLARIGVGIGEASASPASYSLLQDYFPKSMRATVLAIYASGIYVGGGMALVLGGKIAQHWDANYTITNAPFGLSGWQATYLAFGIPGLILALLMFTTVREPVRGAIDGLPTPGDPHPVKSVAKEFAAMVPPWNWRGYDRPALVRNLVLLAALALLATLTVHFTDGLLKPEKRAVIAMIGTTPFTTNMVQWIAIAVGIYCSASWFQTIRLRDAPSHRLIANRGFVALTMIGALMSYISYGLSPFVVLYAMKHFALGPEAAVTIGLISVFSGGLGATAGGIVGDWLKRRSPAGRVYVMLFAALASVSLILLSYTVTDAGSFYILVGLQIFLHIMWLGPCAASIQDLVLPRMRGTATAVFFLGTTIIGLGLGPYVVGLVSDVTGDLRFAMQSTIFVLPLILIAIGVAIRSIPQLEASLVKRARAAGEAI